MRLVKLIPARLYSGTARRAQRRLQYGEPDLRHLRPLWARNWLFMGPTFLASGLSKLRSRGSRSCSTSHSGEEKTLRTLHRAEKATLVIEAGLIAASLARMSRWSKPLFSREVAPLFVGGTLLGGIVAPMALLFGKESRSRSIVASVLALAGGLAFRFAIKGRQDQRRRPRAYFTFASGESPAAEDNI